MAAIEHHSSFALIQIQKSADYGDGEVRVVTALR